MKPVNCVETIAILVCTEMSNNSFKNEIADKLTTCVTYLSVYKQMTDIKLLQLHSNT